MSFSSIPFLGAFAFLLVGAAGCGDSDSGTGGASTTGGETGGGSSSSTSGTGGNGATTSAGGGGGSTPESVLGTRQDGACDTVQAFADACDAEGGLLADHCQDAACGGPGYRATCYVPPPAPTADEFSCDGLFNCSVGELCSIFDPVTDGCFSHACETLPVACADDPTCACLLAASELSVEDCEEDADGNLTFRSGPL